MSFIDVPNVPGVPPLPSYGPNLVAVVAETAIALLIGAAIGPQWGIFLGGAPVLAANSTVDFDFKQDFVVPTYQQEDGGFQSYDKVQLPIEIRVRVSSGADPASRAALLQSIDAVMNTLSLYDVVTPDEVYTSFNFTHRDYPRDAAKAGYIVVDLWLTEIRVTSTSTYGNTQQPGNAGQTSTGAVQPTTPNQQVQQSFDALGAN